jgi:CBS domain containing-hemolysin-like protein
MIDGGMAITAFNQEHAAKLDDSEYTTVGGYLFGQLGRLPRVGDRVTGDGLTFEIAAMEGRRVKSVRVVEKQGSGVRGQGSSAALDP